MTQPELVLILLAGTCLLIGVAHFLSSQSATVRGPSSRGTEFSTVLLVVAVLAASFFLVRGETIGELVASVQSAMNDESALLLDEETRQTVALDEEKDGDVKGVEGSAIPTQTIRDESENLTIVNMPILPESESQPNATRIEDTFAALVEKHRSEMEHDINSLVLQTQHANRAASSNSQTDLAYAYGVGRAVNASKARWREE